MISFFYIFVRDLEVEQFTISLMRCVGDGVDPPTGTKILLSNPCPILGLCTTHDNLLVVCVVVCVACVAIVIVSSLWKSGNAVIVVVSVVLVAAAVVTVRIGPGGQRRDG